MKDITIKKSKLSIRQIKKIVELFAADCTASEISKELSISRITINKYFLLCRHILLKHAIENKWMNWDESYCSEFIVSNIEDDIVKISFIKEEN